MKNSSLIEKPVVSIIIVNYFSCELVRQSVDSIKKQTKGVSFEVIIVDNSLNEDEFNKVLKIDKDLKCVKSNCNKGFGYGNNLGRKFANGRYLLFLNPDTIIVNDAISIMHSYLSANDSIGAVGPNIFDEKLRPNCSYVYDEKNLKNETRNSFSEFFRKKVLYRNKYYFNKTDSPLEIKGFVCGACLMIKTSVFDRIHGFDERIFMYAEESLLCYKITHELGLSLFNIPSAKIIHLEGGSIGQLNERKARMIVDGNFYYYQIIFGDRIALLFLKKMAKKNSIKSLLLSIIGKKEKSKAFKLMASCFKERYFDEPKHSCHRFISE